MMNRRPKAGSGFVSEDEDLYSGYNDFPTALATEDFDFEDNFQNRADPVRLNASSRGRTPGTALGTAVGFNRDISTARVLASRSGTSRPRTGMSEPQRPMTAVRGAGYTKNAFDPINQPFKNQTPSIEPKPEDTAEEKMKALELKINDLVDASILAGCKGEVEKALELAKDAANKEKSLMRIKEQASANEGHDWDITFSVLFNLGTQYEANEMYTEALATYNSIWKNKYLVHGARVKINMGNIYFKQKNPTKAIKMYRMAMDQLNNTNRDLRLKLMHNMGIIFLKIGHPNDASASFEYIMQEKPSFKTGLHSVLANFLSGDKNKMKRSFQDLLEVEMEFEDDEEKYTVHSDDPVSQLLVEVLKNDKLRKFEKEKKLYAERCILSSARLIAPVIEPTFGEGFQWVTEALKGSKHSALSHALEISKALVFLKQRELTEAIEILKSFEKKETKVATAAATNLSFMFFLQGDLEQAQKHGEIAKNADFYNSAAYVNVGNCMYAKNEFEKAKKYYMEAVETDSGCVEALYNLGIVNQALQFYEEALECFLKVQSLVRNHTHVTYEIGKTHELMGETEMAIEWYLKALSLSPSDPRLLKKIGTIFDMDGDRQQAYQYYFDSYRYDPSDLETIHWLANYLESVDLPERASGFYERAISLEPDETKWPMAIGRLMLKLGNYSGAFDNFHKVYKQDGENVEALNELVTLSKILNHKEAEFFKEELGKVEKLNERQISSGRTSMTSGRGLLTRGRSFDEENLFQQRGKSPIYGRKGEMGIDEETEFHMNGFENFEERKSRGSPILSKGARSGRRNVKEEEVGEDIFEEEDVGDEYLPF